MGPSTFMGRLEGEVELVRRAGGAVSLVLLMPFGDAEAARSGTGVMDALDKHAGVHPVVGLLGSKNAVLLPATPASEALRVAERIVRVTSDVDGRAHLRAGVATVYGDVEGGGSALVDAAEAVLREALPGQPVCSRSLGERPSVLVVDDDLLFCQFLSESLDERGWDAHPCTTVADALQRVSGPGYDAVFVDFVIPPGDGIPIVRRALASRPSRPVVLMSGYDLGGPVVEEVRTLGPVSLLRKPFSGPILDSIVATLRLRLRGRACRGAS